MIQPIDRKHLGEVYPEALDYIVALERDMDASGELVERLRAENLRIFDRLRSKCRHCAETAEILG